VTDETAQFGIVVWKLRLRNGHSSLATYILFQAANEPRFQIDKTGMAITTKSIHL